MTGHVTNDYLSRYEYFLFVFLDANKLFVKNSIAERIADFLKNHPPFGALVFQGKKIKRNNWKRHFKKQVKKTNRRFRTKNKKRKTIQFKSRNEFRVKNAEIKNFPKS